MTPGAAMVEALAAYLRDELRKRDDFCDADAVGRWPEPSEDLKLHARRVVVAIERGVAERQTRLGGPVVAKVTPTTPGVGDVLLDFDEVSIPVTLGVWASSQAMRDDADEIVHELLNQPYWRTVPPKVSTTIAAALTPGEQTLVPASMDDIWPGTVLSVDGELVVVADIVPGGFVATLTSSHGGGAVVAEVAARRESWAVGLQLRCAEHFNAVARFDFDESRPLDAEATAQRQEWRSVAQGTARMPRRRVSSAVLQKSLVVEDDAGTFTAF